MKKLRYWNKDKLSRESHTLDINGVMEKECGPSYVREHGEVLAEVIKVIVSNLPVETQESIAEQLGYYIIEA